MAAVARRQHGSLSETTTLVISKTLDKYLMSLVILDVIDFGHCQHEVGHLFPSCRPRRLPYIGFFLSPRLGLYNKLFPFGFLDLSMYFLSYT